MGYLELGLSGYMQHFIFYILGHMILLAYYLTLNKKNFVISLIIINSVVFIPLYYLFKGVNDPYTTHEVIIALYFALSILYLIFWFSIRKETGFDYSVIYSFQDKMFKFLSRLFILIGIVCFMLSIWELYVCLNVYSLYRYRSIFMLVILLVDGFIGIIVGIKFKTVIRKKFPKEVTKLF